MQPWKKIIVDSKNPERVQQNSAAVFPESQLFKIEIKVSRRNSETHKPGN